MAGASVSSAYYCAHALARSLPCPSAWPSIFLTVLACPCLPAHFLVRLLAHLFLCLSTSHLFLCLSACPPIFLFVCLPTFFLICLLAHAFPCPSACPLISLFDCLPTYFLVCLLAQPFSCRLLAHPFSCPSSCSPTWLPAHFASPRPLRHARPLASRLSLLIRWGTAGGYVRACVRACGWGFYVIAIYFKHDYPSRRMSQMEE